MGGTPNDDAGSDVAACGPQARAFAFAPPERVRGLDVGALMSALVVQADGAPLFVYVTAGTTQVIRAARRAETDDAGASVSLGYQVSRGHGLVVAPPVVRVTRAGGLRIAYVDRDLGYTIRYIEWSGDFNENPVDTSISSGRVYAVESPGFTSLGFDLDPEDHPGIIYLTYASDDSYGASFAANAGGGWQTEIVNPRINPAFQPALAFDSSGAAVLFTQGAWMQPLLNGVGVLTRRSGGWTEETPITPSDPVGSRVEVRRDRMGQLEVFFRGTSPLRVVGTPGSWDLRASLPVLPFSLTSSSSQSASAFAFGSDGQIHLVYGGTDVRYAYFDGCTWSTQVVAASAMGVNALIALDPSGAPHIAYQTNPPSGSTDTGGDLWYLHPTP
jgi:hypothetical protein